MANSLSSLNPEFWAAAVEESLYVENTAFYLADMTVQNLVSGSGDTVNFPILSHSVSQTYTPGSDLSPTAATASNEQLTIGTWLAHMVEIDDTEKRQSAYEIGAYFAKDMMQAHKNKLEQAFLAEVTNASHTVDAGAVGGSAGSNISLNTDNVPTLLAALDTKFNSTDVPMAGRTLVVGAHTRGTILEQQSARWTSVGDTVNNVGRIGTIFGWEIVHNNNLPFTAVLSLATQPTNGDTITIAGVTITLHATLVASAWADIRTDVDTTRTFIRDLINYGNGTGGTVAGTVGTDFTDVSSENRFIWRKRGLLAVDSPSGDTLTLTGYGDIVVSETLTDGTDGWGSIKQNSFALIKGEGPKMAVQIPPKIEVTRNPDQFSDIVKSLLGYGKKTTADAARKMINVPISGTSWV